MELLLLNTDSGLKPMYDQDYDEKRKLKLGKVYKASIKEMRNLRFHRKFWAMINYAYNNLNEEQTQAAGSIDNFRKVVTIEAGFYNTIYLHNTEAVAIEAKSISFEKMDNIEFEEFYGKVKDVLFRYYCNATTEQEMEEYLSDF